MIKHGDTGMNWNFSPPKPKRTPGAGVAVDVAPRERKEPEEPFDPGAPQPFESNKNFWGYISYM